MSGINFTLPLVALLTKSYQVTLKLSCLKIIPVASLIIGLIEKYGGIYG